MTERTYPETMTQGEFAALVNCKPGYITKLKAKRVLVMTPDGRRVRVRESLAAMEAARQPEWYERPLPETMTQAEFAALINRKPAYISQLKTSGVLVTTPDGSRVRVRESIDAIEAARNPAFDGVAARHEAARQAKAAAQAAQAGTVLPAEGAEGEGGGAGDGGEVPDDITVAEANRRIKIATAREKQVDAAMAEIKLRRECGDLLRAADVRAACAAAATEARHGFERMIDVLAPQLAASSDESRIRELLADEIAYTLETFARTLSRAGGGEA